LVGAYAFAVWDAPRRALLLARDHVGLRPLYYHLTPQRLLFASEIKGLLAAPDVPRRLNALQVGYFLSVYVGDNRLTFYEDIVRLAPAHTLQVTAAGEEARRYWALDPTQALRLSDAEAAEAFRAQFMEAVQARLRSAFPAAVLLSGGLDSSSVAVAAQALQAQAGQLPLATVSATYPRVTAADESAYIDAVLATGQFTSHRVAMDAVSPLGDAERVQWLGDEPVMSPTFYIAWNLMRAAAQQGARVVLDGVDGDTTVSHGNAYLAELARAGRWADFAREAQALAGHEGLAPVAQSIHQYGLPYLRELARDWRWGAFRRGVDGLATHLAVPRGYLWRNYGLRSAVPPGLLQAWRRARGKTAVARPARPTLVRADFARQHGLAERMAEPETAVASARADHFVTLSSNLLPSAFELADRAATAFGVESRHPFADRRLMALCLALPGEQKLRDGWVRYVLRQAMAGLLPDVVRWRGGKTRNSPAFTDSLIRFEQARLDAMLQTPPEELRPFVDMAALAEMYRRYRRHADPQDEMLVWQAATLAMWLQSAW
ncbi:MAG: lasso peptide isopeptide bond-forming cyclase, partial [Anaerolineales bacterium]|nr:lasso peptide isopeptide bond-forming cyclase [Anaerolineales bacterium]